MEKTGFFEEAPGKRSMMRLNSFILMFTFIGVNAIYFLNKDIIEMNFIILDFIMLLGIFVPKYLQKFAETGIIK